MLGELGCRIIWHNFVKVGDNCTKICNLAYIRTYNRCVKNQFKILNRLRKNEKNQITSGGGDFFDSHCIFILSDVLF